MLSNDAADNTPASIFWVKAGTNNKRKEELLKVADKDNKRCINEKRQKKMHSFELNRSIREANWTAVKNRIKPCFDGIRLIIKDDTIMGSCFSVGEGKVNKVSLINAIIRNNNFITDILPFQVDLTTDYIIWLTALHNIPDIYVGKSYSLLTGKNKKMTEQAIVIDIDHLSDLAIMISEQQQQKSSPDQTYSLYASCDPCMNEKVHVLGLNDDSRKKRSFTATVTNNRTCKEKINKYMINTYSDNIKQWSTVRFFLIDRIIEDKKYEGCPVVDSQGAVVGMLCCGRSGRGRREREEREGSS